MTGKLAKDVSAVRAMYHCDICSTDLTNLLHIRCAHCKDFDICVPCFANGKEKNTHQKTHPYRIIDYIKAPIFVNDEQLLMIKSNNHNSHGSHHQRPPTHKHNTNQSAHKTSSNQQQLEHHLSEHTWGADEELLLLEGIEIYGFGNWSDISDNIATNKSRISCANHYRFLYLLNNNQNSTNSNKYLPDDWKILSKCSTKQQDEVLKMFKEEHDHIDAKQTHQDNLTSELANVSQSVVQDTPPVHEPNLHIKPNTLDIDNKDQQQQQQSDVSMTAATSTATGSNSKSRNNKRKHTAATPTTNITTVPSKDTKDGVKLGGSSSAVPPRASYPSTSNPVNFVANRPKPRTGLGHLVGYIPNRGDFDTEYENDAELIIADMEFRAGDVDKGEACDTDWEINLKLKVLEIYNTKLDARAERKNFIISRQLLERKEKKRSKDEREIYNNMRCFARFFDQQADFETFIQGLVNEQRLRKRIEQLQHCRMMGIKTMAEVEKFDADQREEIRKNDKLQKQKQQQLQQQQLLLQQQNNAASINPSATVAANSGSPLPNSATNNAMSDGANSKLTGSDVKVANDNTQQSSAKLSVDDTAADAHMSLESDVNEQASKSGHNVSSSRTTGGKHPQIAPSAASSSSNSDNKDNGNSSNAKFDVSNAQSFELLSDKEAELCQVLQMMPVHYLQMKEQLIRESFTRGYLKPGQPRQLLQIDVNKSDKVVDFLVKAGWANTKQMIDQQQKLDSQPPKHQN